MKIRADAIWGSALAVLAVGVIVAGCAGSNTTQPSAAAAAPPAPTSPEGQPTTAVSSAAGKDLSGNELWGQYCGLCHNAPSPKDYSDGQWGVAMAHMRVQARLTGEEERKIRQFLQASN